MQRTNIIMQSPCHNYFVVLHSKQLQTAQRPGEPKKHINSVVFWALCHLLYHTLQDQESRSQLQPTEPGLTCHFPLPQPRVRGSFLPPKQLWTKELLFRNPLTAVPSARVQPEKRLARSPSKLVVLWIANKSNFTSISFALVRIILASSVLKERGWKQKKKICGFQ